MQNELCTTLCSAVKPFIAQVEKRIWDAAVGGCLFGAALTLLAITWASV
jgi:hypothetical protein